MSNAHFFLAPLTEYSIAILSSAPNDSPAAQMVHPIQTKRCDVLTDWDRSLLRRFLGFYKSLDGGQRTPTTPAQVHFVEVCRGQAKPQTQHEIAYHRYLKSLNVTGPETRQIQAYPPAKPTSKTIAIIDAIEDAEFFSDSETKLRELFDRLKELYRNGEAKARRIANDGALWTTTILSDPAFARSLERWMGETFNTISNAYTQAMDGAHALGLKAGEDYVSPTLHRLLGGHTPAEAWRAVHDAIPDDTFVQEFLGCLAALGSDMSSVIGLPVMTMTKDKYEAAKAFVTDLGIPESWFVDILHYNAVEVITSCMPMLALLLNWNLAEAESFARLVGSLSVSTIVAGNPVMAIIAVVMLARSYQLAHRKPDQSLWAKSLAEGGITSGLVLASSAVLGGPAWVGLVTAICLVGLVKKNRGTPRMRDLIEFIRRQLSRI